MGTSPVRASLRPRRGPPRDQPISVPLSDTGQTDYKITSKDSPYGKDVCRQLADACHKQGVALGWYYSPRDWYHADFATENRARYIRFYLAQLREICTNYGRVDIFWFDEDSTANLDYLLSVRTRPW